MIGDIIFSFGENYYEGYVLQNIISFLINLFGVLIGAFLAYLAGLSIYNKQRKDEKKKEIEKSQNLNNARLRYLYTLVDCAIANAEKQSIQYKELSNTINREPYEKHLVSITLTNDFQRIKSLDNQKVFEAYYNNVDNTQIGVKDYVNLFHTIDYIDLKLLQMFDMHKNHNDFTFRDQTVVRDIIEDIVNVLTTLILEIIEAYPENYQAIPIYDFTHNVLQKSKSDNTKDFSYFENEFLIPLEKDCREVFSFNKGLSNLIFEKVKRARARLRQIKFNSEEHAKNCYCLKETLEPKIKDLKGFNSTIKKNVP